MKKVFLNCKFSKKGCFVEGEIYLAEAINKEEYLIVDEFGIKKKINLHNEYYNFEEIKAENKVEKRLEILENRTSKINTHFWSFVGAVGGVAIAFSLIIILLSIFGV